MGSTNFSDISGGLWLPLEHWACLHEKYVALQWLKTNENKLNSKCIPQDQTKNCTALHSAIRFVDRVKTKHTNIKRAEHFGKVLDALIEHDPTILFKKDTEENGDILLHVCARLIASDDQTAPDYLKVVYERIQKLHPLEEIEPLLKTKNKDGDTSIQLLVLMKNAGTLLAMKQTKENFRHVFGERCAQQEITSIKLQRTLLKLVET